MAGEVSSGTVRTSSHPAHSNTHTQRGGWTCAPQAVLKYGSEILPRSHFAYAFSLRQPDKIFILPGGAWYSQCKLHTHLPAATEGENNRMKDWVFTLASSAKCKWLP